MDPCLRVIESARNPSPPTATQRRLQRLLRDAALYAPTPFEAFETAVLRELAHLRHLASQHLTTGLTGIIPLGGEIGSAAAACQQALHSGSAEFPRQTLTELLRLFVGTRDHDELRQRLQHWLERHDALGRRVAWLADPELTRSQLSELDPKVDADQIWSFVKYDFRPQILHAGWANAIKRVTQNQALSTFIHATRRAETSPVKRTEDTLYFLYYRFNWGRDSSHGAKAVQTINQIHGRYAIPQEGMKFVLLVSAFCVLDAIDALGHRKLTETERLGYFHATIDLGREMNISELSDDYGEMLGWFRDRSAKYSGFSPQKRRLWLSISESFDLARGLGPVTARTRRQLELIAMDDDYRNALGFSHPGRAKRIAARVLMRTFAHLRSKLPREAYVESLQPCFSYPEGASIEQLGEKARSESLPATCPFSGATLKPSANHGFPHHQLPVETLETAQLPELATVSWQEVAKHSRADDLWLVFDGYVYDVSAFAGNHPGGLAVLLAGHGRDLTEEYDRAGHSDMARVFALNFRVAKIERAT